MRPGSPPVCVAFLNVRTLASDLRADLAAAALRLTLRPFNRYAPDRSPWWLIPGTDWPAYHRGKVILMPERDGVFVGVHVEKGFGPEVVQAYPATARRGLIADGTWAWDHFVESIADGSVADAADKIVKSTRVPVRIRIQVQPAADPTDFDPYAHWSSDFIEWVYDGVSIKALGAPLPGLSVAAALVKLQSWPDLARNLRPAEKTTEWAWYWVDAFIGVPVRRVDAGFRGAWAAEELLDRAIWPWLPWVR